MAQVFKAKLPGITWAMIAVQTHLISAIMSCQMFLNWDKANIEKLQVIVDILVQPRYMLEQHISL